LDDFRALLLVPLLSKNNRVPQDVYRTLSLNIASEATQSTDKATAPKRILAFFRLCVLYISCEFDEYDDAVRSLDSEVDSSLRSARLILEMVQEQNLPTIIKAQNEAISTLLQVLYFLQHGHVQFLIGDYKAHVIDAYGPNAFAARIKAKKLSKDGLPREVRDVNVPPSDEVVDMLQNDDEGAVDSDDEGKASTFNGNVDASSEAAGFGSDTSPRNETGDNDELNRAERK
jgi:hypothetical protein